MDVISQSRDVEVQPQPYQYVALTRRPSAFETIAPQDDFLPAYSENDQAAFQQNLTRKSQVQKPRVLTSSKTEARDATTGEFGDGLSRFRQQLKSISVYRDVNIQQQEGSEPSVNLNRTGVNDADQENDSANTEGVARTLVDRRLDPLQAQLLEVYPPCPGTCEWIHKHPKFEKWRDSESTAESPVLLVLGDPGLGKSVLAKSILLSLEKEGHPVMAFFCRAGTADRESTTSILASFIHRLLEDIPKLSEHIINSMANELDSDRTEISFDSLWKLFVRITQDDHMNAFTFIIDAIDECIPQSQGALERALLESAAGIGSKLLFTARFERYPMSLSKRFPFIEIESDVISADMTTFISDVIRSKGLENMNNAAMVQVLKESMDKGAEGMFLRIAFRIEDYLAELDKPTFSNSQEYLEEFFSHTSGKLFDYWGNVLDHTVSPFDEKAIIMAAKVFNLILASQVMVGESVARAAFAFSEQKFLTYDGYLKKSESDIFDRAKRICGPFLRIRQVESFKAISIVHPTARQFLERTVDYTDWKAVTQGLSRNSLDLLSKISVKHGHALMARACLSFLLLPGLAEIDTETLSQYPFLPYAVLFLTLHIRESKDLFTEYADYLHEFFAKSSLAFKVWHTLNQFFTDVEATEYVPPVIIFLVENRLENLVDVVVRHGETSHTFFGEPLDINAVNESEISALQLAIVGNQEAVVATLLKLGASTQSSGSDGITPLHLAVIKGMEKIIRALKAYNADFNAETKVIGPVGDKNGGKSPLFFSISTPPNIFALLLDLGTTQIRRSADEWSILHEAALDGHYEAVKMIVKAKLFDSVDITSTDGWTPLHAAAGVGASLETVLYLCNDCQADVNRRSSSGLNALYEAASNENIDIVRFLLSKTEEEHVSSLGWTALHIAAYNGSIEMVEVLLNARFKITKRNEDGDTALHLAIQEKHEDVAMLLLEANRNEPDMDVDQPNKYGFTPLFRACCNGLTKAAGLLIALGANTGRSANSLTCLHMAAYNGNLTLTAEIIAARRSQSELGEGGTKYDIDEMSSEASWTPLFAALFQNHTKVAKLLLDSGADPTVTSSDGWNVLHMAARYTNDDSLFEMLFAKLDEELFVASDTSGDTPLHFVASSGLLELAKQLLLRKADPFAQNKRRVTPLFNAAIKGHSCVVKLFLDSDGEFLPDLQTSEGWTALDAASLRCDSSIVKQILETTNLAFRSRRLSSPVALAIRHNNVDVIDVLIQGGISVNLSGSTGWTALHEATHRGEQEVVFDLIEKHKADITQLADKSGLSLALAYRHRNDELNRMLLPQDIQKFRRLNIVDTYAHAAAASTLFAAKSLVKLGLPVTDIDGVDDPCLSQAAVWGLADIIEYLLQQPGVKDQINFRGRTTKLTPLHLASRACSPESIALLLAAGGSATDEDIFGYTAYDYALRHEQSFTALVAGRSLFQRQLYRQKYRTPERRNRQRILRLVCVVITWIQNESSRPKTPLTLRDKRSAIHVLLQAFFMLGDIDHASTAFELLFDPPSSPTEDSTFTCNLCLKHCKLPYFACLVCPCLYLCESCSKKTQLENMKGCFQHDFIQLPRKSWYTRKPDEVSEDLLSESSWLESVLSRCEQEKDRSYIWPPVEFPYEYDQSRTDIIDLCRSSNTDRLQDHLTHYPRDIIAQDKDGQTLPTIFIQFAGSDSISLSGLKLLAREGADLLEYTLGARSTVQLACEKEFPLSLAFLLEERSSSFDTMEDEFASTALKTMILKNWKHALYAAIEYHFDWFARGEYTWLQDLRLSGLTEKDIAEILESSNLDDQTLEETIGQNFWAVFSQPLCLRRPILGRHRRKCIHELQSHLLSAPVRATFTADVWEEDEDLGEKYFDTDSDTSEISHGIDMIGKMCGLAGLFPESDGLANFTVYTLSDDLEETWVSIRYPYHSSTILFETVKKAGVGLLEAFRTAQELELCCDSFVVLHFNSDISSTNVAFLRLEMRCAVSFIELATAYCDPSQREEQQLSIWESITQVIRELGLGELTNISMLARSSEDRFDICCLVLQFLGLGFTLYLGAHLSRYVLPVLETAIARFVLLGCTGKNAVEFKPYRMACLGRMMQDNVVAFSIITTSATQESSYLEPAEQLGVYGSPQDLLDLWGPGYCIKELDNTGSPTGKLSAIELRGGRLVSNADEEETLRTAHWSPTCYESTKSSSVFTLDEKLLIGTLRVNERCNIDLGQSWARASSNGLENLDTSAPYWAIVDWTLNFGFNAVHGGGGVSAKVTEQPGRLKKTSIIECWRSGKWKVLDGPWGVRWSVCTGFVERVPLRRVVGEVLDDFLRDVDLQGPQGQVFPPGWDELRNLLRRKLIGGPLDSEDQWDEQIDSERFAAFMSEQRHPSHKVHVYSVVTYILEHLKNTGVDSQGTHFQVAWTHPTDNLSTYRFECSGQSKWTTILQDTRKKATFAIATADCLVSHLKKHPFARLTSCRCLRPEDGIINPMPIKLLDTKLLPYQLQDPAIERWRLDQSKNYSFLMEKSSNYICRLEQTGRRSQARRFLIVLCLPVDIASITVERIRRLSKDKQVLRESDQWSKLIKGHYLPQPVIICSMSQWKEENNIL